MRPKDTHQTRHNGGGSGTPPNTQFLTLFFFIMSKQVMISMLKQGNTGAEILSILDALTADNVSEVSDNEPTADVIEF